jgi:hypothetical protein
MSHPRTPDAIAEKLGPDPKHTAALTLLNRRRDQVTYAMEALPRGVEVRDVMTFLNANGIPFDQRRARSNISQHVNAWRAANGLADTAGQVQLTPQLLAELDRLRADQQAAEAGVPDLDEGQADLEEPAHQPEPAQQPELAHQPELAQPEPAHQSEPARKPRPMPAWPVFLLALPAFVAVWSGWVGLGHLSGFGLIQPFPGFVGWEINTAITLPIGVETYAAYALYVWLSGRSGPKSKSFARASALGSLILGAVGQVAFHVMTANGVTKAPDVIITIVAVLPVAVLGMGAALYHLVRASNEEAKRSDASTRVTATAETSH